MDDAPFQRGLVAQREGRLEEAEAAYREALRASPTNAAAYNLGVLLLQRRDWPGALEVLSLAQRAQPDQTAVLNAAACALTKLHRASDAEHALRVVLQREPTLDLARYRLAEALLAQGRYVEAWPYWESRPSRLNSPARKAKFPEWNGEPLAGKKLLVWGEQGLGDEIMAARFISTLKQMGCARIAVACQASNMRLFESLGVHQASDREGRVLFDSAPDYWVQLWSIPGRLGVARETLSGKPYLQAPAATRKGGIGVALRGNPMNPVDRNRSLPNDALAAQIPGAIRLEPTGDTLDSLAQLADLDLVITVDTSWAHLAGALGVPCWVLIADNDTDWRWCPRGAEHSPWYDSFRLFWQKTPGDWSSVIDDVLRALRLGEGPRAVEDREL